MALNYFKIQKGLNIADSVHIIYGTADPSAGGGVAAVIGSLYCETDSGNVWHKVGSGDTAWNLLLDSAGASTEDTYQNTFMGKTGTGSETPTYSSTHVVTSTTSLETAIGALDAEIGAAVTPETRTNNPTSDQAINLNIDALDSAIGTDAQHVNTNYTTVNNSINQKISDLDGAILSKIPIQSSASNQDASTGLTADSVVAATYSTVEWLLTVIENGTPANKAVYKIVALYDSGGADADYTVYSALRVGAAISGLAISVDFSTPDMRLRITATPAIDYKVTRIMQ